MINDIIKNRYIVCQSPGHGKRIIDFFVNNGASNAHECEGVTGYYYTVGKTGIIRGSSMRDTAYTEMQLPEEFTPKRGDVVLTDSDILELRRIRNYFGEHDVTGFEHMAFSVLDGIVKRAEPINQTITKAEAERMLGKTIEG